MINTLRLRKYLRNSMSYDDYTTAAGPLLCEDTLEEAIKKLNDSILALKLAKELIEKNESLKKELEQYD